VAMAPRESLNRSAPRVKFAFLPRPGEPDRIRSLAGFRVGLAGSGCEWSSIMLVLRRPYLVSRYFARWEPVSKRSGRVYSR